MSESISDIVREMRSWPHHEVLGNWPDRIEAVADFDAKLFAVCVKERNALHEEVVKLRNELVDEIRTCERLRDALRKIMETFRDEFDPDCLSTIETSVLNMADAALAKAGGAE